MHSWKSSDSTGYCGAELTFLCDAGYEQEVKGPYLMGYRRDSKALVSHLKMPELNQKAFKVTVGTKVKKRTSAGVSYDDFGEIVYKDDEFVVGSVIFRRKLNRLFKTEKSDYKKRRPKRTRRFQITG